MPFERAESPIDFDPDIVFVTVADLRCGDRSEPAVFELDDCCAIVVERATFFESAQMATDTFR